jgi:hypothetical protein
MRLGQKRAQYRPSQRGVGIPSHDDRHLFEVLILGGAQAGLSWVLCVHAGYRDGDRSRDRCFRWEELRKAVRITPEELTFSSMPMVSRP